MENSLDAASSFLLLLPPVTLPLSIAALKAAYGETLLEVLKEAASASSESTKAAILEIAVACPDLVGQSHINRADIYDATQRLVAAIYKLVVVVATQEKINVEDDDGVDARVLLVAWSLGDQSKQAFHYGPVITLQTLAQSKRPWQYAFGVESDAGEAMVRAFVAAKTANGSGTSSSTSLQAGRDRKEPSVNTERDAVNFHVAVGGTFDHLHIGHKLLLTMTALTIDGLDTDGTKSLTVGITGDELLQKKKHAEVLQSWQARQQAVQAFLDSILVFDADFEPVLTERNDSEVNGHSVDTLYRNSLSVKCTEISDPFGPTITEEQISALIISGETRAGGKAVNDKRREKGWSELHVFEVDVLDADEESGDSDTDAVRATATDEYASKISSTAIREKIARKNAENAR